MKRYLSACAMLAATFVMFFQPSVAVAADRPATVLLITDDTLREAWQPLADWKTRCGKATKIVTVKSIGKKYKGKDTQEKIRACVLDHIDNHATRWVILGGDSQPDGAGHVPDRDTPHVVYGRMKYSDIPTDAYYVSRKSWDANADGVYGQWKDDGKEIEYTHPKASIGRIPVRTAADVKSYTAKVIQYETKYPAKAFAKRMVYTCPIPMAYPKLTTSRKQIQDNWNGETVDQFFASKTPWDKDRDGDHALSPANWTKMINDRSAGKLHIHGHGLLSVWVLEDHKMVDATTVASLTNSDAYPIVTTVSCFTGQYDAQKDPSITESMIRKSEGGAIAIIAPAREGVPIFADPRDMRKMVTEGKMDGTTRLLTDFWTMGLKNSLTIGEAVAAAKSKMTKEAQEHSGYHWCLSELNLLGDPTLDMRSGDPATLEVKAPQTIATGSSEVKIKTGKPHMTVCLWKGDEVYATKVTDDRGVVALTVSPSSKGTMLLTVAGPNANTFVGTIEVK